MVGLASGLVWYSMKKVGLLLKNGAFADFPKKRFAKNLGKLVGHDEEQFSCSGCDTKFMNIDPLKVQHNHHQSKATGHDEEQFSCSQ